MRKLLLIVTYLTSLTNLRAQDFGPSPQSQNYLDSKNATVDHATGLFRYTVPVYTLKSGDFKLPITLNYVGKGVRGEDKPGLLGCNWNLNVGGVVTRTLRGGFADENYPGYAEYNSTHPEVTDTKKVNNREVDGESDIFTAVFGGQSVDFIITKKSYNNIEAVPLEKTDVKIEYRNGQYYEGEWVITNGNGDRFYFGEAERSSDIVKEEAISFNGVRKLSYISSWYLSRIEPRNGNPIHYTYRSETVPSGGENRYDETTYSSGYASQYHYGWPMGGRSFDFSPYDDEYRFYMNMASDHINWASINVQASVASSMAKAERDMRTFKIYAGELELKDGDEDEIEEQKAIVTAAMEELRVAILSTNEYASRFIRILGQIGDFTHFSDIARSSISTLSGLAATCNGHSNSDLQRAGSYFGAAKNLLIQCLTGTYRQIQTREVANVTSVKVRSPLLDEIACNGKTVKFEYVSGHPRLSTGLLAIRVKEGAENDIFSVSFGNGYDTQISSVRFFGKDGGEFNRIKFGYYRMDGNTGYDLWGFRRKEEIPPEQRYGWKYMNYLDGDYCKDRSLATITTSDQGEIRIDYESHVTYKTNLRTLSDAYDNTLTARYGGIRVKSLVTTDPTTNAVDTIKYHYPYPGELVYVSADNEETVEYAGFSDHILHSRMKTKGEAFLNSGNNGVYYGYVEEEFVGKGKKTYLFFTPSKLFTDVYSPYKFWLNGLPLGVATYDKTGNLKTLTKNRYLADVDDSDILAYYGDETFEVYDPVLGYHIPQTLRNRLYGIYRGEWFSPAPPEIKYSQRMLQIKAYEYYLDHDRISRYYQDQGKVLLWSDGYTSQYINPYNEVFLSNIEPRTRVVLPQYDQQWELVYGGKVLLKSQEEYRIEGHYSTASSVDHFRADLGTPFTKMEYFYDNIARSTAPTRITTTDSKGDVYTSVVRRVGDMDVPGILAEMKAQNILSPVVKQSTLKNNTLLSEQVNVYAASVYTGKNHFVPTKEKRYLPADRTTVTTFPAQESNLFPYGEQNYTTEKEIVWKNYGQESLPATAIEKGDSTGVLYHPSHKLPLLQVKGYGADCISATNPLIDTTRVNDFSFGWEETDALFTQLYNSLLFFEQYPYTGQAVKEYRNSPKYFAVKTIVEGLAKRFQTIDYQSFTKAQMLLRSDPSWFSELIDYTAEDGAYVRPEWDPLLYNSGLLENITRGQNLTESLYLSLYSPPCVRKIKNPKLKLWIVSNFDVLFEDFPETVNIEINHDGIISPTFIEPFLLKNHWNMQVFDIDVSSYANITSVIVTAPYLLPYAALIPADCEFEATGYNPDGTVFCKFNQTGQAELYEYDNAGRVVKIFDQNGNLLQENTYHITLP